MNTTQNHEVVDVNCPPPAAALKMVYERIKLRIFNLDGLKKADKGILAKMTDLEIDLSDSNVDAQNIDEALAMLKNYAHLETFKLKMPKLEL